MKLTSFTKSVASTALLVSFASLGAGCDNYLNVNDNPNGPSANTVSANLYLAPMLNWLVSDPQWDVAGGVPQYEQDLMDVTVGSYHHTIYDEMGDWNTDTGTQSWRDVYWSWGQNLIDMNNKAQAQQRWDLLGVGMILKGWGWMELAGLYGNAIVKEAFDQSRSTFDYDTEGTAYAAAKTYLDSAIVLLKRTDGGVDATYLSVGDHIYNGDRTKWLKFAYGARAILENRYSNKSTYDAKAIMADVDNSFSSNADDALLKYLGTQHDDYNFFGPTRQNLNNKRQTQFTVSLMDGTVFGGTVDPRMSRMLAPSPDGLYRGMDPNQSGFGAYSTTQRPMNLWGYPTVPAGGSIGRYLFADHAKTPVMTYSELQFVKAEAALRSGDKTTALTAYTNGISSHIDFVNARNQDDNQTGSNRCVPTTSCAPPETLISDAEKTAFLASPNIVPAAANLTMSDIMAQKFIAQWGWNFYEQWMDMRRFHYTDHYAGEAQEAFPGFQLPTTLYVLNAGKVIYRLRPRLNSEYVWNADALAKIQPLSGLADDYQTSELWIVQSDATKDH